MAFLSSKKYSLTWKMACSVAIFFLLISPLAPLSTSDALAADPVSSPASAPADPTLPQQGATATAGTTAQQPVQPGKPQEPDADVKDKGVFNIAYQLYVHPGPTMLKLVMDVLAIIVDILGKMLTYVGMIFNWSLGLTMRTDLNVIKDGWDYSLSLANMLFALIFLAIAIGTILQLTSFHWKKALPLLLITILLINFSFVIGEIVIDFSNFFAVYFANSIIRSGGDMSGRIMGIAQLSQTAEIKNSIIDPAGVDKREAERAPQKEISEADRRETWDREKANPSTVFTGQGYSLIEEPTSGATPEFHLSAILKLLFVILFELIALFILLAGLVYMFLRTFHLWSLLMLAPLFWITLAIPGRKEHFNSWWKRFAKWAFFAPVYLFFTFFAFVVAAGNFKETAGGFESLYSGITATSIIQLLLVAFIMIWGIYVAEKMGIKAGNFVIDFAKETGSATKKKFSQLRGKPLSERAGEWGAKKFAGALTLGGRVSVPGIVSKKEYKQSTTREALQKAKERYENESTQVLWELIHGSMDARQTSPELSAAVKEFLSRHESERQAVATSTNIAGPGNSDPNMITLRAMASAGARGDRTF